MFRIDATLYPDVPPPRRLVTRAERIDFVARLCAAWDFGLLPDRECVAEIRHKDWRDPVDECELLTSPAYHLLRDWHGLSVRPYLGRTPAYIARDPFLSHV